MEHATKEGKYDRAQQRKESICPLLVILIDDKNNYLHGAIFIAINSFVPSLVLLIQWLFCLPPKKCYSN